MKSMVRTILLLLFLLPCVPLQLHATGKIVSYALVQEDGSLQVSRNRIWLYGIYIPPTDHTCRTYQSPIRCGPRAILALDFKIESYFVSCEKKEEYDDGSITALCTVKGEDLSAWMLKHGWAVALPDAPFEYHTLEKIAQYKKRGIWGHIIDSPG